MSRALRAALLAMAAAAAFVGFGVACLIFSWIVFPVVRFHLRRQPETVRIGRFQDMVGGGFRFFIRSLQVLGLMGSRPQSTRLDLPRSPFVMIANHPTLIDVTVLMGLCPKICCVVKPELFRAPGLGRVLRDCGHIEGGDGDPLKGGAVIQEALMRCRGGQSVLMFPEGTRSPEYGLNRFQPGVFEISIRGSVPIVPILITCEPPTLMKGLPWYALPKRAVAYDLVQLPTVPAGSSGIDSRGMAALLHATFRAKLEAWKSGLATRRGTPAISPAVTWTSPPNRG